MENVNVNENLKPFAKGADERRNTGGRPKKFVSQLKTKYKKYKLSQINDAIQTLLALTKKELTELSTNPDASILELTIATALLKDLRLGKIDTVEMLLSRTYGKPKQTHEIVTAPEIIASRHMYSQLRQKGLDHADAIAHIVEAAKINGFEISEDDILEANSLE
jgi:hypothetical protein